MTHPLEQRLDDVRRRANRLRFAWGAARVAALAAGAWIALAGADAVLRSSHPAWRWIALGVWVVCIALAFRRWFLPTLRRPLTIEGTAIELERRFPSLEDRLSDAVGFLRDRRYAESLGSSSLRRRMINETWSRVEPLDLTSALSRRSSRIAEAVAMIAMGVLAIGLAVPNSPLRLASLRMLAPWASAEWPRRDRLVVEPDVRSLVRGGRFAIEVYDAEGTPPERVTLEWRTQGAGVQTFDLARRNERFRFERTGVEVPFAYRVVGGEDDAMAWRHVEIVDPAKVTALEALVSPPPYLVSYAGSLTTREPGFVRALAGSSIDVEVGLDPAPPAARLVFLPDPARGSESVPQRFDLAFDAGRNRWRLPTGVTWKPERSGEYRFEEADGAVLSWDAAHGGEPARYRVEIVPDGAPRVVVSGLRSGEPVTPGAALAYRASIQDDVGIGPIVQWEVQLEGEPGTMLDVRSGRFMNLPKAGDVKLAPQLTLEFDDALVLSDPRAAPGTTWIAKLVATDLAGNRGESAAFRLPIVTPERMRTQIADRESQLLAMLREALRLLRDSMQEVREVDLSVGTLAAIDPGAADRLQRAASNHRNAGERLFGDEEGAIASIDRTLASIAANGLEMSESIETLQNARATLTALRTGSYADGEASLRDALAEALRTGEAKIPEFRATLADAARSQDASIVELERLIDELSEWDSYRRFRDEIDHVTRDQESIDEAIGPVIDKLLRGEELDAKDRALAVQLADRQRDVARRLGKAVDEMESAAVAARERDGLAADTLQNAVDVARERGVGGFMQEVARLLETSDWATADRRQAPIADALDEIAGALDRRREKRLDRQAGALRDAAREARELADVQRDANASDAERDAIRERTDALRRKLERLGARDAAREARDAETSQDAAAAASDAGDADAETSNREEAADRLDRAADAAQAAAEQAERLLAEEVLAKMKDFFEGLKLRQERLRDESLRLAEIGRDPEGWTPGRLASVRALADQQQELSVETHAFGREVESFKAFRLGLSGAADLMERASALARRRRLEPDAVDAQNLALGRLEQLLAALAERERAEEEPSEPQEPGADGGAGESPPAGNREDALNRLAELRLLASMQQELLRRTREIENRRAADGALSPDMNEEFRQLAEEQGALAEILNEYARESQAAEPPADDPLDPERLLEDLPGSPDVEPE